MAAILVLGGGIAGCAAALRLAEHGLSVILLEKAAELGGKVKGYGCKSAGRCQNCGVCLGGRVFPAALSHPGIRVITGAHLRDLSREEGRLNARGVSPEGVFTLSDLSAVIVAVGFEPAGLGDTAGQSGAVIPGHMLEAWLAERTGDALPGGVPASVAFVQCWGSRNRRDGASYCSRVCCGYALRAAGALRHLRPDLAVTFFYMDLQCVAGVGQSEALGREYELICCRPAGVEEDGSVRFEEPATGRLVRRSFDLVVCAEGVRPPEDAPLLAELCTLGFDPWGFLRPVRDGSATGVYLAGCASGPKSIAETYADAISCADRVLRDVGRSKEGMPE